MSPAAPLASRLDVLIKAGRWHEALDCFLSAPAAEQAEQRAAFLFVKHAMRMRRFQLALDWLPRVRGSQPELRLADFASECHTALRQWVAAVGPATAALRLSDEEPLRAAKYLRALANAAEPEEALSEFFRLAPKLVSEPVAADLRSDIAEGFARRQLFEHARVVLLWGCQGERADFVARLLGFTAKFGVGPEMAPLLAEAIRLRLTADADVCERVGNCLVELSMLELFPGLIELAPDPASRALLTAQFRFALEGALPDAAQARIMAEADVAHHFVPAAAAAAGLGLVATPERAKMYRRAAELTALAEPSRRALAQTLHDGSLTVAVVGNSPVQRGRGDGPAIDAHNVVIRFNKASLDDRYAGDFGVRTTLLVQIPSQFGHGGSHDAGNATLVLKDGFERVSANWGRVLRSDVPLDRIALWPQLDRAELYRICERNPTSGLTVIWTLHKLRRLRNVSAYGFGFVEQFASTGGSTHYFQQRHPSVHSWFRERLLFDALFAEARASREPVSPPSSTAAP